MRSGFLRLQAQEEVKPWSADERQYLDTARVGRLATVDEDGRPHAVPVCFSRTEDAIFTPIDEKPQEVNATELRRVRNIRHNPHVTLVVDHYTEAWDKLGWVQIRGIAEVLTDEDPDYGDGITNLREKYDQYDTHSLEQRPVIRIDPAHVVSWGRLDRLEP